MKKLSEQGIDKTWDWATPETRVKVRKFMMIGYSILRFVFFIWFAIYIYEKIGYEKAVIINLTIIAVLLRYALWSGREKKHEAEYKKKQGVKG